MNKVKLANSTIPVDVDKVRAWRQGGRGLQRSGLTLVTSNGTEATAGRSARTPRSRPDGEFSAAVKLQCRKRAGRGDVEDAQCEACAVWLGLYGGQVQHRLARGSGGSSLPIVRSIQNAALLCGTPFEGCHGKCEKDRSERMRAAGFWLKHGDGWPDEVPILLNCEVESGSGITVWLTVDGEYSTEPPMGGAA